MAKKYNYPSEEALRKMDRKLAKTRGTLATPPDASPLYLFKSELCAQFVIYQRHNKLSQKELANVLDLSEARMSEILHYRHDRFTADLLTRYLYKIKPNLKIKLS